MSTHYSCSLDALQLNMRATQLAASIAILTLGEKTGALPILLYTGMSGIAGATAIAMALWRDHQIEPGMMYVRKENEVSHGSPIERSEFNMFQRRTRRDGREYVEDIPCFVIFVDDFVGTGATVERCKKALADVFGNKAVGKTIEYYALTERSDTIVPEGHIFTLGYAK